MKQMNEQHQEPGRTNDQRIDVSGYPFFSHGETGEAHAMAHRMFDSCDLQTGHLLLGEWLDEHSGQGSDWVHMQFHMALFELELGDWQAAYARFWREILPTAATTEDALTDAPGLLWRLQMTAPEGVVLPWQPLRRTALRAMTNCTSEFVQIHNLLALAGAGDSRSLERGWIRYRESAHGRLTRRFSRACIAIAAGAFQQASKQLQAIQSDLAQLDGSHAHLKNSTASII